MYTEEELKKLREQAAGITEKSGMGTAVQKTSTTIPNTAPAYSPPQSVIDAQNAWQDWVNAHPSNYVSPYRDQIEALLSEYRDRDPFSYDMANDPLYQQYKGQYTKQAQSSLRDTMAQAAALTGGYGSSYATTAGNQAYQSTMGNLNAVVPDLVSQAYTKYLGEGDALLSDISALNSQETNAENQYRLNNSNYASHGNDLYNAYQTALSAYNTQHQADLAAWQEMYNNQQENDQFDTLHPSSSGSSGHSGSGGTRDGYTSSQWYGAYQMATNGGLSAAYEYIDTLKISDSAKTKLKASVRRALNTGNNNNNNTGSSLPGGVDSSFLRMTHQQRVDKYGEAYTAYMEAQYRRLGML